MILAALKSGALRVGEGHDALVRLLEPHHRLGRVIPAHTITAMNGIVVSNFSRGWLVSTQRAHTVMQCAR